MLHHIIAKLGGKKYYICSAIEEDQIYSFWQLWGRYYPNAEFDRINRHFGRIEIAEYHTSLQFVLDYKRNHFLSETISG